MYHHNLSHILRKQLNQYCRHHIGGNINDLSQVCKSTSLFLFADDSNLFLSGNDPQIIQDTMNVELKNISEWLKANKLSLNIKKTHYMLFSNINRSQLQPSIQIEIDNQKIIYTTKTKFVGVVIDHKLNWKDHISYISGKIARGLGVIIKAKKCFNKTAMLGLYYSFIYPYLIYCNHVWGCACTTHVEPLVTLQTKAIRIISGVKLTLARYSNKCIYWSVKTSIIILLENSCTKCIMEN